MTMVDVQVQGNQMYTHFYEAAHQSLNFLCSRLRGWGQTQTPERSETNKNSPEGERNLQPHAQKYTERKWEEEKKKKKNAAMRLARRSSKPGFGGGLVDRHTKIMVFFLPHT